MTKCKKTPLIARITRKTQKLCINLANVCNEPCDFYNCCEENCAELHITRVACPPEPKFMEICDPCCPGLTKRVQIEPEPVQTLVYPVFDLDFETGAGCFHLDCLMQEADCGRYDANVFFPDDCGKLHHKGHFQIDLRDKPRVTRVQNVQGVCHV